MLEKLIYLEKLEDFAKRLIFSQQASLDLLLLTGPAFSLPLEDL